MPHISSLYANPWMGWVLFGLLVLVVVNPSPQMNILVQLRGVFSHAERVYASHNREWGSEICSHVFRLGVVAVAVFLLVSPVMCDSILSFTKVFGVVIGVYALQRIILHAVGRIFVSQKKMDVAMEQYNGICTMVCLCLYPLLILSLNTTLSNLAQILCVGIFVMFIVFLFWKSIRLFYVKIICVLYILLYIICLEIMPLVVVLSLAKIVV